MCYVFVYAIDCNVYGITRFLGTTIAVRYRDAIPEWPGLVIPSLVTAVAAFIPGADGVFKTMLAISTAVFVFEASVEAYVYSSAAVLVAGVYCLSFMEFKETKMHRYLCGIWVCVVLNCLMVV